ncbi:hypothetical protein [Bradyrhizobium sp. Gha]|uniref:hypothetical protein n=1 Tax=Bradyrhizobium sp. Gha TaxID=1855318 RepID=UPI0008E6032A|nr:hypothetical protein [Bradyrhizobium sp. Gha]SFJ25685.1 hypothetical protein SAMN05216525_12147 [Bradyrhizobium sp. Gha]
MNDQYVDQWSIPPLAHVDRYWSALDFIGLEQPKRKTASRASARKPPRLNSTPAILKHAAKLGLGVRIIAKLDGSIEYDIRNGGSKGGPDEDAADAKEWD